MAFKTDLLDAALARRRQENEQQRLTVLNQVQEWLKTWGERYRIEQAYIFGSVIRPYKFKQDSDVDIAVEKMEPDFFFSAIASLSEALGRDVDLVELSKCHFATRIRQTGILWKNKI